MKSAYIDKQKAQKQNKIIWLFFLLQAQSLINSTNHDLFHERISSKWKDFIGSQSQSPDLSSDNENNNNLPDEQKPYHIKKIGQ